MFKYFQAIFKVPGMGVRRGGDKTSIFPPWKLALRSKNF